VLDRLNRASGPNLALCNPFVNPRHCPGRSRRDGASSLSGEVRVINNVPPASALAK
jgi:hypothetical protein